MPYAKLSEVPASMRGVAPVVGGKSVKLTLAQANHLGRIYDAVKSNPEITNPMGLAYAQFRKIYQIKDGKWVKQPTAKSETTLRQTAAIITEEEKIMPETRPILELWVQHIGSYEKDMDDIRSAVRQSDQFGTTKEEWDVWVEATFADRIIVVNRYSNPQTYYQASWERNDKGEIEFSDIKEVTFDVVIKEKNEHKLMLESIREATQTCTFVEQATVDVVMTAAEDGREYGSVKFAQVADKRNQNGRIYPESILKSAVTEAQARIGKYGPLFMDSKHRVIEDTQGTKQNHRDLRETVALIHEISWDDAAKVVTLDKVSFVETQAGKDLKAIVDAGGKLQVSQRGFGISELVQDTETNEVSELMQEIHFDGWDFVPPGTASVEEADFIPEAKERIMPLRKVITEEEAQKQVQKAVEKALAEQTPPEAEPVTDPTPEPKVKDVPVPGTLMTSEFMEEWRSLKGEHKKAREYIEQIKTKDEMLQLDAVAHSVLEEALQGDSYQRFSDEEKKALLEGIDPASVYTEIADVTDRQAVTEAVKPLLESEVVRFDRLVAAAKLRNTGYPERGAGVGITHTEIIDEAIPAAGFIAKYRAIVEKRIDSVINPAEWRMPQDHAGQVVLKRIMEGVTRRDYRGLRDLDRSLNEMGEEHVAQLLNAQIFNEAGEAVTQADIGGRIAMINQLVIPVAWRRITAFAVAQMGTQPNRIGDFKVSQWTPTESSDLVDDITAFMIVEGGTIPTAGIQYVNYPAYATRKTLKTKVTSEAVATAFNTPMDPVMDSIVGLSLDARRRVDGLMWYLQLSRGLAYATTQVSGWTALTQVGSTNEYAAANEGFVEWEWSKNIDAQGNPTAAYPKKLYGTVTGNTLQALTFRVGSGDNTALIHTTDYTINGPDGTITLTGAGVTKVSTNGVEGKYTYSSNLRTWSVVPPTGVTLYDHLYNLRQTIGSVSTLIENRHYVPDFVAMSINIHNTIVSGPHFEASHARAADMADRLDNIMSFAGKQAVKTSALPDGLMVVGQTGAAHHNVQMPWSVKGPITDANTGDDVFLAQEYTAEDVPVNAKLGLVGVTNLNS